MKTPLANPLSTCSCTFHETHRKVSAIQLPRMPHRIACHALWRCLRSPVSFSDRVVHPSDHLVRAAASCKAACVGRCRRWRSGVTADGRRRSGRAAAPALRSRHKTLRCRQSPVPCCVCCPVLTRALQQSPPQSPAGSRRRARQQQQGNRAQLLQWSPGRGQLSCDSETSALVAARTAPQRSYPSGKPL